MRVRGRNQPTSTAGFRLASNSTVLFQELPPMHPNRIRNKDTSPAERAAIFALRFSDLETPPTYNEIGKELGIGASTVGDVLRKTSKRAKENTEDHNPLVAENLYPNLRTGRPPTFDKLQCAAVIEIATRNASQRRKSYAQLARELDFEISRFTVSRVLQDSGYSQHIPRTKPFISEKNMVHRKAFSDELKDKPVNGYFDGWISTDEMYLLVGEHYGPERVIRKADEEWHPDCVSLKHPGQTRIMFWGAIAYQVPCSASPYFIWEEETLEEKELAAEMLEEENRIAEESVREASQNWYAEEMARRQALPKGQRPRGKPVNPYSVTKKTRGKKGKGGIDWFRYRESVCEERLYPFYRQMLGSAERGERGTIWLIEDGAGPHRSKFLNEHHAKSGINKINWPPCLYSFLLFMRLLHNYTNYYYFATSIARFKFNRASLGLYTAKDLSDVTISYKQSENQRGLDRGLAFNPCRGNEFIH